MNNNFKILVINPGSTSTKIAYFEAGNEKINKTIYHSTEELAKYPQLEQQYNFRKQVIINLLQKENISLDQLSAVIGRGGLLAPLEGGTYSINYIMKEDLLSAKYGEHPCNLGALIADAIASELNIPSYIADPVVVDELQDIARYTGSKLFKRKSIFHALNQKAVARAYAAETGKKYTEITVIVAHCGGGCTIGLHKNGRVIDVNNGLDGEGAFSPERTGTLPAGDLARLCFSGDYSLDEVKKIIKGKGGMVSYLGTNNLFEVEDMVRNGAKEAIMATKAMAYQVVKEIGALAAVAQGKVDAIILTGGAVFMPEFYDAIVADINWIAPVFRYGENEMRSLYEAAIRALSQTEKTREYSPLVEKKLIAV